MQAYVIRVSPKADRNDAGTLVGIFVANNLAEVWWFADEAGESPGECEYATLGVGGIYWMKTSVKPLCRVGVVDSDPGAPDDATFFNTQAGGEPDEYWWDKLNYTAKFKPFTDAHMIAALDGTKLELAEAQ